MRKILLELSYLGGAYAGFQVQKNAPTVQQTVQDALEALLSQRPPLTGCSRTDAGVHALGQTAHFDTQCRIPGEKFSFALNTMLPADVRVRRSMDVPGDFHARFQARGKTYRYLIHNAPHASALGRNTHAHVIYPLDLDRMRREARAALGAHDFAAFAASGSIVKDTVRTVTDIQIARGEGDGEEIRMLVSGDGFLYNMVRILAGTLIAVGGGKLPPGAVERALQSKSRLDLGPTAPACGLTLMEVHY